MADLGPSGLPESIPTERVLEAVGFSMSKYMDALSDAIRWRDLLADVLGDIDPLTHSPAIDAAREALLDE